MGTFALICQHLTEKEFGFKLHPRHDHYHCQGTKMVFNGLPVLSAVLVCSTVFFGYVAPNTVLECEDILVEVEKVETCIRDVDFYFKLFDESCSDVDWVTRDEIIVAIYTKACQQD